MNNFVRALVVVSVAASLNGCALFSDQLETAAKGGAKLINFYCDNVSLPEVRQEIRERVNHYAAPNSIVVTCAKDGPQLDTAH